MRHFWQIILILVFSTALASAQIAQQASVSTALNYKSLQAGQQAVLAVVLDVRSGFHAQSHTPLDKNLIPCVVTTEPNSQLEISEPIYPPGELEEYPQLGKLSVYTGKVVVYVPLQVKKDAPVGTLTFKGSIRYQICNDRTCFPPVDKSFEAATQIIPPGQPLEPNEPELFKNYKPVSSSALSPWTIWTALGAALLAGLLFNVMPCVLPVLPLKAMGFYEAASHSRARSFALGLVFSLGLISVFGVLSIFVLVLKLISWGELFSKAWFIWTIVTLLCGLAMGLLGLWNLALPVGVYRLEPRHDTFSGNYFWGALTAILATPCTAPLLPGVLGWAVLQSASIGVLTMLMVGVGMSLPYLLLSAAPELARKFPRTGPWTEVFKQMMGFMLLAAAAYFAAGRLINGPNFWWAVVAVVVVAGVFLVVRAVQLSGTVRGVSVATAFAAVMIGATVGWTAMLTIGSAHGEWEPFSAQRFEELRSSGHPLLIKFTANWCGSCQYIEGTVFRNQNVWKAMKQHKVIALKVDFSTNSDAPGKELLLSLNPAGGIPITALYGGTEEKPVLLESVYTSSELLNVLERLTPSSTRNPS